MKAPFRAAIFGVLGCVCLMSCMNNQTRTKYDYKEGEPNYSSYSKDRVMRIGAWVAPPPGNWNGKGNADFINQERYDEIAESGINVIYSLYENNNRVAAKACAQYAAAAGIKYLARDGQVSVDPIKMELEPGEMHEATKSYDGEEGLGGWLIQDEPSIKEFEKLGNLHAYFKNEYPDKEFYVNLFPTYANISQLGTSSYKQYIDKYIEIVKPPYVSYDHYSMLVDGYGNYKMSEDVLWNLEIVASRCKEAGIPMYTFIQAMSYDGQTRVPNEKEIRHQVMTQLAYGSRSIQYFCYWTPLEFTQGSPAMITVDGKKTDIYDHVKKINGELLNLDEAYLDFSWVETLAIKGSEERNVVKQFNMLELSPESIESISSINATQNTLVGHFEDKTGRDAFLVMNFSDPATNAEKDKVSLDLFGATSALVYHGVNKEVVELNDGMLELELEAGDGSFIIPFK
ncbi:MAG: hypothetical protein IJ247_02340 [Bacilli bacterium]|nr:hypothetical protein [Bacilli bacterium]